MVHPRAVVVLSELLQEYLSGQDELLEIASIYEVEIDWPYDGNPWLRVSRMLLQRINHGNTRELVDALVELLDSRNHSAIVGSSFEYRVYHETIRDNVIALKELIGDPGIPREISVPDAQEFVAKSHARDFFQAAESPVLVVDPYVGVGTLDCLRETSQPIRLLTGQTAKSMEEGFDRALSQFRESGHDIEVRRHPRLHDRHAGFNDRCWLIGSSLKDAGKKAFNVIEIRDAKDSVVQALEAKWNDAEEYRPSQ